MMHLKKVVLIYLSILFATACSEKQNTKQVADANVNYAASLIGNAQREDVFKANCITCHSLGYIEMQPSFPRKTWEKIVDKMVKNFGASIPDSSSKKIVDYLVAIKGKQ